MGYSGKDVTRSKPFSSYLLIGANTVGRKNECFPSVGQWVCFILSRNRNHDGAPWFRVPWVSLEKWAKMRETTRNYSETTRNYSETTRNYTETTKNHTETTNNPDEGCNLSRGASYWQRQSLQRGKSHVLMEFYALNGLKVRFNAKNSFPRTVWFISKGSA